MTANENQGDKFHLPDQIPGGADGNGDTTSDSLPWAIYSLDSAVPESNLRALAAEMEGERYVVTIPDGEDIHLFHVAPTDSLYQPNLEAALRTVLKQTHETKPDNEYFPYGCIVVHDKDWSTQGVWLVYIDCDDDCPVTGVRIGLADVGSACWSLRDDENCASEIKRMYELKN
ncbi:hypothetical protein LEL_04123 [Akanthomyces lecanii RCEF 1005]|uniref:Uncharacterized protein n=1 Tax=Akanthomyces lecanii RCEF 1005 TaxID=1081108 RepID=A0A168H4P1_CORDF|nr:hypothetical protein LEL_04123 [Akanthomyces lecanii RCEF 1005]